MAREKAVAIVGATGAVGREFLSVIDKLDFPVKNIRLLASARSAGSRVPFRGENLVVEELTEKSFQGIDIALYSAGSSITKKYAHATNEAGAVIVDNSSAYRMTDGVPLVIPEINPEDAKSHTGIIANPNCSTIIMLMAVYPVMQKFPVKRIIASTYQAASGAGWAAMEELKNSTRAVLSGEDFTPELMPYPYGFNLFSHNTDIDESGYNEEERKMIRESKKILHNEKIKISATCIRVPILRAHSEAINIEFSGERPSVAECRELISAFPGVQLIDDREKNHFPMPIEASENYNCLVGRIRHDVSNDSAVELFVAGDQLLKGAALNAVQIAALL